MKKIIFLFFLIISSLLLRSQNIETNSEKLLVEAKKAIAEGNAQWCEGWAKGNAEMVAAIFAEDGIQLSSGGKVIKGRQNILDRQKKAMKSVDPGVKVTITTTAIWIDGILAYETGKYKYEYTEKGKPSTEQGKYVTIWKKQQDRSWKLVMDMGVPND